MTPERPVERIGKQHEIRNGICESAIAKRKVKCHGSIFVRTSIQFLESVVQLFDLFALDWSSDLETNRVESESVLKHEWWASQCKRARVASGLTVCLCDEFLDFFGSQMRR